MILSSLRQALLACCVLIGDCALAQSLYFSARELPGSETNRPVPALQRPAPELPQRYRLILIPGSGCSGLGPVAQRMFRGLLHAELWLLHKPGVRLDAGPAPQDCPPGFVQGDDLRAWLAAAKAALTAIPLDDELPLLLVGMSEGAELLPFLAAALPRRVDGLVLISGAGIDPVEAGALQARRLGESAPWQALERAQGSSLPDEQVIDGRTLRYWRGLWDWRSEAALLAAPVPVLQVWGDADALLPAEAFERFAERAQQRPAGLFCRLRFVGADHGLQAGGVDGLQQVWAVIERWARRPGQGLCAAVAGR